MKRMLINATQPEERRLAIVDGQKLLDFETEIEGREQRKGNIYKAVVTRVEPSLEACFVDYGEDRHGFLPFKEISPRPTSRKASTASDAKHPGRHQGRPGTARAGREGRARQQGRGADHLRLLAGRYLVLMPNNPRGGGVSRRIEGEDREELKENLDQLEYPKGMSLIARTAGIGRSAAELQWDLNYLLKLWDAIDGAAKAGKGAFLIYQESQPGDPRHPRLLHRDIGEILIDTDDIYEQAQQFMNHVMPERPTASSATATTRRCSAASRSSTRSKRPSAARSTCPAAAPSSSTTPRRWSRSTSTRRAPRAAATSRRPPPAPTSKRPTRSPPDAAARPGRPDRHRLHRHGGEQEPREVETACATRCASTAPACSSARSASSACSN
jgi:Ribonuclease G/E